MYYSRGFPMRGRAAALRSVLFTGSRYNALPASWQCRVSRSRLRQRAGRCGGASGRWPGGAFGGWIPSRPPAAPTGPPYGNCIYWSPAHSGVGWSRDLHFPRCSDRADRRQRYPGPVAVADIRELQQWRSPVWRGARLCPERSPAGHHPHEPLVRKDARRPGDGGLAHAVVVSQRGDGRQRLARLPFPRCDAPPLVSGDYLIRPLWSPWHILIIPTGDRPARPRLPARSVACRMRLSRGRSGLLSAAETRSAAASAAPPGPGHAAPHPPSRPQAQAGSIARQGQNLGSQSHADSTLGCDGGRGRDQPRVVPLSIRPGS
jgi:hypothetical protein